MSAPTESRRAPGSSDKRMTLRQHLLELRNRALIAAAGILAGAVGGWFLYPWVWASLTDPVKSMGTLSTINFQGLTDAFDMHMAVSIYVGIILSSPLWLYEVFAFFTPGLTRREKAYVFGFLIPSVLLFLGGCTIGWYAIPHIVDLFLQFTPNGNSNLLHATDYFNFVLKLMIVAGIAFVLPVFLVLLDLIGIVNGKALLKAWRWAVLGSIGFTALATPATDPITMMIMAIPLLVLYFAACFVSLSFDKRKARRAALVDADLAAS
ncbi:twin-arginine translocase subunit TatC [Gryllotalpicola sp.]|uniref:twin-arginine translocase subunit TatC n=1 Tax=Gryllotalpicola sp. TaxID=1932787 RepID=UPI00261EE9CE|nr:twin-arginine translocase subunit TatC [Gryllotalpicola sp.]